MSPLKKRKDVGGLGGGAAAFTKKKKSQKKKEEPAAAAHLRRWNNNNNKNNIGAGTRIEIWWKDDKRYYAGVLKWRHAVDHHRYWILYDDGEEEWVDLDEDRYNVLPSPDDDNNEGDEDGKEESDKDEAPQDDEVGAENDHKAAAALTGNGNNGGGGIAVGTRVSVFWQRYNRYYVGTVTKIRSNRKRPHYIVYEDGDDEWTNLYRDELYFLVGSSPVSAPVADGDDAGDGKKKAEEDGGEKAAVKVTDDEEGKGTEEDTASPAATGSGGDNAVSNAPQGKGKEKQNVGEEVTKEGNASSAAAGSGGDNAHVDAPNDKDVAKDKCNTVIESGGDDDVEVGSRVSVWWGCFGRYYDGTVTEIRHVGASKTERNYQGLVKYDDGDEEWVSFLERKYKRLKDSSSSTSDAEYSALLKKKSLTSPPSPSTSTFRDDATGDTGTNTKNDGLENKLKQKTKMKKSKQQQEIDEDANSSRSTSAGSKKSREKPQRSQLNSKLAQRSVSRDEADEECDKTDSKNPVPLAETTARKQNRQTSTTIKDSGGRGEDNSHAKPKTKTTAPRKKSRKVPLDSSSEDEGTDDSDFETNEKKATKKAVVRMQKNTRTSRALADSSSREPENGAKATAADKSVSKAEAAVHSEKIVAKNIYPATVSCENSAASKKSGKGSPKKYGKEGSDKHQKNGDIKKDAPVADVLSEDDEETLLDSLTAGSRVSVLWDSAEGDTKEYYDGVVVKLRKDSKKIKNEKFFVVYDDGDEEWVDLRNRIFKLLDAPQKQQENRRKERNRQAKQARSSDLLQPSDDDPNRDASGASTTKPKKMKRKKTSATDFGSPKKKARKGTKIDGTVDKKSGDSQKMTPPAKRDAVDAAEDDRMEAVHCATENPDPGHTARKPVREEPCPLCKSAQMKKPTCLDCCHIFCKECIKSHCRKNRACPVCKVPFNKGAAIRLRSDTKFAEAFRAVEMVDPATGATLETFASASAASMKLEGCGSARRILDACNTSNRKDAEYVRYLWRFKNSQDGSDSGENDS